MRNYIIKLLGGITLEQFNETNKIHKTAIKESIERLEDWQRGISIQCKDTESIKKADKYIQNLIKVLPISTL